MSSTTSQSSPPPTPPSSSPSSPPPSPPLSDPTDPSWTTIHAQLHSLIASNSKLHHALRLRDAIILEMSKHNAELSRLCTLAQQNLDAALASPPPPAPLPRSSWRTQKPVGVSRIAAPPFLPHNHAPSLSQLPTRPRASTLLPRPQPSYLSSYHLSSHESPKKPLKHLSPSLTPFSTYNIGPYIAQPRLYPLLTPIEHHFRLGNFQKALSFLPSILNPKPRVGGSRGAVGAVDLKTRVQAEVLFCAVVYSAGGTGGGGGGKGMQEALKHADIALILAQTVGSGSDSGGGAQLHTTLAENGDCGEGEDTWDLCAKANFWRGMCYLADGHWAEAKWCFLCAKGVKGAEGFVEEGLRMCEVELRRGRELGEEGGVGVGFRYCF